MSSPDPKPLPKPRWDQLKGWGWFAVPLFLNLIVLSMPIFDYGYTNSVIE